jgi:hypothetical protein
LNPILLRLDTSGSSTSQVLIARSPFVSPPKSSTVLHSLNNTTASLLQDHDLPSVYWVGQAPRLEDRSNELACKAHLPLVCLPASTSAFKCPAAMLCLVSAAGTWLFPKKGTLFSRSSSWNSGAFSRFPTSCSKFAVLKSSLPFDFWSRTHASSRAAQRWTS